jgi:O-antigen/teichoic acid export membrane protein
VLKQTWLYRWAMANRALLANAGSLVGTTALTSGLGFVYWWVAARTMPTSAVGFASASIAAMSLLATIGMLGLGTLLIGELPRQPEKAGELITTALVVAGVAGFGLGVGFAYAAPLLSREFLPLSTDAGSVLLFATGVGVAALSLVLDQALLGFLRGDLQLWRNGVFAVAKLLILGLAALIINDRVGLNIYGTWLIGNVFSIVVLGGFVMWRQRKRTPGKGFPRPDFSLLRGLGKTALSHHILNLSLLVPSMVLPILVTTILGATTNAYFYIAWMIANLVFAIPASLTTVLYAVGAANPSALAQKVRLTVKLSLLVSLATNIGLVIFGGFVLSFFGRNYTDQALWCLYILGLGAFAITFKDHYVALYRIYNRVGTAIVPVVVGSIFELVLAAVGAILGGLPGLALGWLAGMATEAVLMSPIIYRAAFPSASKIESEAETVTAH